MIILCTTILLMLEYIILDFLLSGKKNLVKNVTFGISSFFFMFLIISEVLFAFNHYSLFRTYLICGGIALIIIILLFFLRYKGSIKHLTAQEKKQVVPPELFIILMLGFLLSINRFELFGMGQDQGVYQIKAILMTEGDNDNYFNIKESELINNESDRERLHEFIELQKAGAGFYSLETNVDRGTISVEQNDPYTGIFHGLPNFPALLSISGRIFGMQGIMYIPALFYLLSIIVIFLICYFNLELKRSTSDIITFLFTLSPIVVWVSKSALTEIVLTLIILMFVFLITSKEISDKWLLWFPIAVFSFTHVSIYTMMPMFIIVFVILVLKEKEKGKSYFVAGIISTISYLVGLIVMGFTSPRYTFDNYMPLLNLVHAYSDINHTLTLVLIGAIFALVILTGSYVLSRKTDYIKVQPNNFLNIFKMLVVLGILVIIVRWFLISYQAAYDTRWNYYKNKGFLGSLQNITLFGYLVWSGAVLIPVNIFFIFKEKDIISKRLLPIVFMFIYCIILYSAFLRFEIQYYYYYSRYLAPFLPIIFVLGGYFIDHYLKLKVFTGIISFMIFIPFTLNLALFDDISRVDFQGFIKAYEAVLSVEEKSTVVIEDSLSPYFYYPLDFQPNLYVFSDNLFGQMQDISFLDEKKVFYLSTRELLFSPLWSIPMKSSSLGTSGSSFDIGGEIRITDLFRRRDEEKEVYLYELSAEQFKKLPLNISSFASSNGTINKEVLISNGTPGFVLYGNYQDLDTGDYKYTFEIRLLENNTGNNEVGYIDIVTDRGQTEQVKIPLTQDNIKNLRKVIEVPFRLIEKGQAIEGRVYANEGVKLEVGNVRLKEVSKN